MRPSLLLRPALGHAGCGREVLRRHVGEERPDQVPDLVVDDQAADRDVERVDVLQLADREGDLLVARRSSCGGHRRDATDQQHCQQQPTHQASPQPIAFEYVTACGTDIPPGVGSEIDDARTTTTTQPQRSIWLPTSGATASWSPASVLDRAQLDELADGGRREPGGAGPWAIDYTPSGSTGRFFGDYVNWERIDGYRHAALDGPLPRAGAQRCSARRRASSTSTRW